MSGNETLNDDELNEQIIRAGSEALEKLPRGTAILGIAPSGEKRISCLAGGSDEHGLPAALMKIIGTAVKRFTQEHGATIVTDVEVRHEA